MIVRLPTAPTGVITRCVDNDPNTWAKLVGGVTPDVAPYTSYVVFDLQSAMTVSGFQMLCRTGANPCNPKNIDFFYWTNETVNAHKFTPNTSDQIALDPNVVFASNWALPALNNAATWKADFTGGQVFTAQYVGIRINDSWDTPAGCLQHARRGAV